MARLWMDSGFALGPRGGGGRVDSLRPLVGIALAAGPELCLAALQIGAQLRGQPRLAHTFAIVLFRIHACAAPLNPMIAPQN